MKLWTFSPLDSCFFRGARPFNAGEGGFLESIFPPTAQTMCGVVRAAIGEAKGVCWDDYREKDHAEYLPLNESGEWHCAGPYVLLDGERVFPVPFNCLYSSSENRWAQLIPATASHQTDHGKRRLPIPSESLDGSNHPADRWLSMADMTRVLAGALPQESIKEEHFITQENRTGIARDNHAATVNDGMLYFTRHVRMQTDVTLAMLVGGQDAVIPASMVAFGGEGRMASLSVGDSKPMIPSQQNEINSAGYVLYLLTHGDFLGKTEPPLPDGITIVSACIGKAVREGGWNYQTATPKPLIALMPAGSCYFITGDETAIHRLHGSKIGARTAYGYGEVAIGVWRKTS